MKRTTGKLIALEGIDACGKSTQAAVLAEYLQSKGVGVVLTHEPFTDLHSIAGLISGAASLQPHDTPESVDGAVQYRLAPEVDALLFAADRAQHVHKVIAPALAQGKTVVTDRYYPSSIVYQSVFGGLDPKWVAELNAFAPRADVVVLLDMDAAGALKRVSGQSGRRFERFEVLEKQEKIRKAYLTLAREEGWAVVDAAQDKAAVLHAILAALQERKLIA